MVPSQYVQIMPLDLPHESVQQLFYRASYKSDTVESELLPRLYSSTEKSFEYCVVTILVSYRLISFHSQSDHTCKRNITCCETTA